MLRIPQVFYFFFVSTDHCDDTSVASLRFSQHHLHALHKIKLALMLQSREKLACRITKLVLLTGKRRGSFKVQLQLIASLDQMLHTTE